MISLPCPRPQGSPARPRSRTVSAAASVRLAAPAAAAGALAPSSSATRRRSPRACALLLAGAAVVLSWTTPVGGPSSASATVREGGARGAVHGRGRTRGGARQELIERLGTDWDEVIVTAEPGAVDDFIGRHGGSVRARRMGWEVLRPPAGDRMGWALGLEEDPGIHRLVPNATALHPGCRQMSIDVFEIGERVDLDAQEALARVEGSGGLDAHSVTVAVVDSGVALVEELEGRVLPGIDVLAPGQSGLPHGEGRGHGRPLVDPDDPEAWDGNGHGTAMATLLASLARGARILPVRVVGEDCIGNVFDVALGIRLAAEEGADVISVSLGTARESPVLSEAIEAAQELGALVVAASGNDGVVEHPAALPGVVAVTAVGADDWPAAFAATGPEIDLAAPGVDVLARAPQVRGDGEAWLYLSLSGTSPAAAIVSAGAAAVVQRTPGASPAERAAVLRRAVRPVREISPLLRGRIGEGVLDLAPLR